MITPLMIAYIVALIIIAIVIIAIYMSRREGFENISDKAQALSDWVIKNPTKQYEEYIIANPKSNIVEYAKLRSLMAEGLVTNIDEVKKSLRIH